MLEQKQMIHIFSELVIILSICIYFRRQNVVILEEFEKTKNEINSTLLELVKNKLSNIGSSKEDKFPIELVYECISEYNKNILAEQIQKTIEAQFSQYDEKINLIIEEQVQKRVNEVLEQKLKEFSENYLSTGFVKDELPMLIKAVVLNSKNKN